MKSEEITKEQLLHNPESLDEYAKYMGIVFTEITPGEAKAVMTLMEPLKNPLGSVHGGALFSMADIVSGVAANATGDKVTTLDSSIQFLSPALFGRTEHLYATATTVKRGKTIHVITVEIRDDNERLIATAQFSFFVMQSSNAGNLRNAM